MTTRVPTLHFRWLVRADGSRALQQASPSAWGYDWFDIPEVQETFRIAEKQDSGRNET